MLHVRSKCMCLIVGNFQEVQVLRFYPYNHSNYWFFPAGQGLLIIVVGLVVRLTIAFLATFGNKFRWRTMIFIAISWIPKATVQVSQCSSKCTSGQCMYLWYDNHTPYTQPYLVCYISHKPLSLWCCLCHRVVVMIFLSLNGRAIDLHVCICIHWFSSKNSE
jgi:hypothetical protein